MGIAYNTSIVRDGLVLHMDAANPKSYSGSGDTWYDLIDADNNATLYNSPTHNAEQGYFSFNGVDQYALHNVEQFNSGNNNMFTFEVWFKMRTLPTAQYSANEHIWGGQNGNSITLNVNTGGYLNLIYDDSRYTSGTGHFSSVTINANEWTHWVSIGDGVNNTISHYINGVFDKTGPVVSSQHVRTFPATSYIARDTRWNTYSQLDVSTLKYYNRNLSEEEIKNNFNALRGRFGL